LQRDDPVLLASSLNTAAVGSGQAPT
jgi:hypothetical protein